MSKKSRPLAKAMKEIGPDHDVFVPTPPGHAFAVSTAEARASLSHYTNIVQYGGGTAILTRNGKPVVAIVPISAIPAFTLTETTNDESKKGTKGKGRKG